ncbi:MAG: hypothetical protein SFW67_28410 [Myxococcaceae bacterium]|nr:hypothetical protein [Myxococcaceae bacterium]
MTTPPPNESKSSSSTPVEPQGKGGKKSPARDQAQDRIPTPDAVDLSAVKAAVKQVEDENARREYLRVTHMSDCAATRDGECACPANLHTLTSADIIETKEVEASAGRRVKMARVDEGYWKEVEAQDPTISGRVVLTKQRRWVEPRWVCLACGWACRAPAIHSHDCQPELLLFKARPLPLSHSIPPDERFSGAFRLTIWRDAEGEYHVGEVHLRDGRVLTDRELFRDGDFPALEGYVGDRIIEAFTP